MSSTLEGLVKAAHSSSSEEQSEAVFQLAMLLEKSTRPSNEVGFYESVLSPDLHNLVLDKKQQKEIIAKLRSIKELEGVLPALIWAIGKAMPEAGVPLFLEVLRKHADLLTAEAAYQAVIVLDNYLDWCGSEGKSSSTVESALKGAHVVEFLQRSTSADDHKLAEHARRVLRRLQK
jgi:hypothetical protein